MPAPAAITNFACPRNNNQFCRTRCRRGHMLHPALRHSPIASNSPCNSTPSTSTGRPRPHPSAVATARPAYWASWADTLPILHSQAPPLAATIRHQLTHPQEATASVRAAIHSAEHLRQHGWEPPAWDQLLNREVSPEPHQDFETPAPGRGWQQAATRVCNRSFRTELLQAVDPASHAMLESQSGPNASRPFTTIPYNQSTTYPSHLFRTLLLRRLRLPLPLSAR